MVHDTWQENNICHRSIIQLLRVRIKGAPDSLNEGDIFLSFYTKKCGIIITGPCYYNGVSSTRYFSNIHIQHLIQTRLIGLYLTNTRLKLWQTSWFACWLVYHKKWISRTIAIKQKTYTFHIHKYSLTGELFGSY